MLAGTILMGRPLQLEMACGNDPLVFEVCLAGGRAGELNLASSAPFC